MSEESKEVRAEVDKCLAKWKKENREAYDRFNEQYSEHVKKHLNGDFNTKMEGILPMMGSTTNDPQGEYKREPLLSDKWIGKWEDHYDVYYEKGHEGSVMHEHHFPNGPLYFSNGAEAARKFYEDLITDGTLILKSNLVTLIRDMLIEEEKGAAWDWHDGGQGVSVCKKLLKHLGDE